MNNDSPNEAGMAILDAVKTQIKTNEPPKTKETFKRLMAMGIERDEALKFIGCAMSVEVFGILKQEETFNLERYIKNLDNLPDLPWGDEE